jgi:hypothetical protein
VTVNDVAVIGYSNTFEEVSGAHLLGLCRLWAPDDRIKGGTLHRWATQTDDSRWWTAFDEGIADFGPPARVFWQIGIHAFPEELADPEGDAHRVYDRIRERFTGPIDVSPCSRYDPPTLNNEIAVDVSASVAAKLVSIGLCEGPQPAVITREMAKPDGIHVVRKYWKRLAEPVYDTYRAA